MTTITIKNGLKESPKTYFETAQELYIYLRENLFPVPVFLVDDGDIPKSIRASIEEAEQEGESDVIDFKG